MKSVRLFFAHRWLTHSLIGREMKGFGRGAVETISLAVTYLRIYIKLITFTYAFIPSFRNCVFIKHFRFTMLLLKKILKNLR